MQSQRAPQVVSRRCAAAPHGLHAWSAAGLWCHSLAPKVWLSNARVKLLWRHPSACRAGRAPRSSRDTPTTSCRWVPPPLVVWWRHRTAMQQPVHVAALACCPAAHVHDAHHNCLLDAPPYRSWCSTPRTQTPLPRPRWTAPSRWVGGSLVGWLCSPIAGASVATPSWRARQLPCCFLVLSWCGSLLRLEANSPHPAGIRTDVCAAC